MWHLSSDEAQDRSAREGACSGFHRGNRFRRVKPGADVLAQAGFSRGRANCRAQSWSNPFGRERAAMAMCTAITRRAGRSEFTSLRLARRSLLQEVLAECHLLVDPKTLQSGRRRLLAETDKRLYRPGASRLRPYARTFSENAAPISRLPSGRLDHRTRAPQAM